MKYIYSTNEFYQIYYTYVKIFKTKKIVVELEILDEINYSAKNCRSYPGTTIFWLRLQELEFTCFRDSRFRKKKEKGNQEYNSP